MSTYQTREWGLTRQEGHLCPEDNCGVLEARPLCTKCMSDTSKRRGDHFVCSSCGKAFQVPSEGIRLVCTVCRRVCFAGWRRHYWADSRPATISGLPVRNGPLFHTIQRYASPPADPSTALQLADFYLDIDREHFKDALKATQAYLKFFKHHNIPVHTFYSGSKGFHLQIPHWALGAEPTPQLHERIYRELAVKMAGLVGERPDYRIYSRLRMIRVPNTRHAKSGRYKVYVPSAHLDVSERLATEPRAIPDFPNPKAANSYLNELYQEARVAAERRATTQQLYTGGGLSLVTDVPCVEKALNEGAPAPGTRHKLSLNLASYLVQHGDPERLIRWAQETPGNSQTPASVRVAEAQNDIKWAQRERYPFRCSVMQELDLCDPNCPFYSLL